MLEFILSALRAAIPAGTPLLFGTLGEVYAERSGVLNLGVEGMMIMGAVSGFAVAQTTGSVWLGILAAAVIGDGIDPCIYQRKPAGESGRVRVGTDDAWVGDERLDRKTVCWAAAGSTIDTYKYPRVE